ncbi:MAG: phosphoribosylformylglycinamidine cyclo-ligase [Deltaproteobacteria bacterium]|nr:phosphoribosylformylglycinamidine cyclo-ligase [Deltaproteobacteria bacterium]
MSKRPVQRKNARNKGLTYKAAGVDIAAADSFVASVAQKARATFSPLVFEHALGYSGLMRPALDGVREPLIAATCDGVGTKLLLARAAARYEGLGQDLVAMSVNDLLPVGARPLLFLDYIAAGKLDAKAMATVIDGVVRSCREVGCTLLGGETAEMPGLYAKGDFDLAGFAVGIADRTRLPRPETIQAGDRVLALASTGIHANGLSLARRALLGRGKMKLGARPRGLGKTRVDELLTPTALYVRPVLDLMQKTTVKAAAHITGGGLLTRTEKLVRGDLRLVIEPQSYRRPPIFDLIAAAGAVSATEMARTFNMGLGFVVVLDAEAATSVVASGIDPWIMVGAVVPGRHGVDLGYARS